MLELGPSIGGRCVVFLLGAVFSLSASCARADSVADDVETGRLIYQEGKLPSGKPLQGVRKGSTTVSGMSGACVTCHRRSGMGAVEGNIQIPPITGNALFGGGDKVIATMDPRSGKAWNQRHAPYTDASLAEAVQRGTNNSGREMSEAMPRYRLGMAEMKALSAYLKQLSGNVSPGVSEETIRFATVVTPDVAPERKQVLIDMMRAAFAQKNGSTVTGMHPGGHRHMVSAAEMVLKTERKWVLDVWELKGAPQTWAAQLDEFYRLQPVFALVSGLSGSTWEPVHNFCEREQIPCWFPSVDLPSSRPPAFYAVYFSQGVELEAAVLARHLSRKGKKRPHRLLQVYRDGAVGRGAAHALSRALVGTGIAVEDRVLSDVNSDALHTAVAGLHRGDAVMFWLRPADLAALEGSAPLQEAYFSARLGGELAALPASWKESAQLVYPYELPEKRMANLAYFHEWLKSRNLALVDEPMQSEVYFSLNYLTDTIAEMLDNLYRDYLLERGEDMISKRENGKAEEEARARDMLRLQARAAVMQVGKGTGTTIYPRLSLAPTQRFASKGGYIVRFADSNKLVAESEWIVP